MTRAEAITQVLHALGPQARLEADGGVTTTLTDSAGPEAKFACYLVDSCAALGLIYLEPDPALGPEPAAADFPHVTRRQRP